MNASAHWSNVMARASSAARCNRAASRAPMGSIPSASFRSLQTRCAKADRLQRSQPHFMGFSIAEIAEDPRARVAVLHLQIETAPVGEHSGLASVCDLQ